MNRYLLGLILSVTVVTFFYTGANAQTQKPELFFRIVTPAEISDKNYGQIRLAATDRTIVVNSIMAYGENVNAFTVSINGGFPFKLAPAPSGQNLNYVASAMQLVLQPGDVAVFSFVTATPAKPSTPSARHIFLSGTYVEP